ncbi:hypothetical protein BYT27DRAFT_7197622 [Phlegmacium glaucopus]|nr:hypothetical protein BYT27DRAFT_7197622 [Phlegmacium glaucopus]
MPGVGLKCPWNTITALNPLIIISVYTHFVRLDLVGRRGDCEDVFRGQCTLVNSD